MNRDKGIIGNYHRSSSNNSGAEDLQYIDLDSLGDLIYTFDEPFNNEYIFVDVPCPPVPCVPTTGFRINP